MRKTPTPAEARLWEILRRKQVGGARFRRQRVIGPDIVDFCCLDRRLVVEVDGEIHAGVEQQQYDAARTEFLEELGYRVVRIPNVMVLNDLDSAVKLISHALNQAPSPVSGEGWEGG